MRLAARRTPKVAGVISPGGPGKRVEPGGASKSPAAGRIIEV
jgi:hypothetical protein